MHTKGIMVSLAAITLFSTALLPLASTTSVQAAPIRTSSSVKNVRNNVDPQMGYMLHIDKVTFTDEQDWKQPAEPYGTLDVTFKTKNGNSVKRNIWSQKYVGENKVPSLGSISNINIPISTTDNFKNVVFSANIKDDDGPGQDDVLASGDLSSDKLSDNLTFDGVRHGVNRATVKTNDGINVKIQYHIEHNVTPTWPNNDSQGWNNYAGEGVKLVNDPENTIFGGHAYYSDKDAAINKHFKNMAPGKYEVTVFAKGLTNSSTAASRALKVSLKKDSGSTESRTLLLANPLSSGEKANNGYYKVSNTVDISADETNPLIVVENYQGGYIGGVYIQPVNNK